MIIYDNQGLANLHIQQEAENAHDLGLIIDLELKNIKENYPNPFYTPTLLIRIGYFILTLFGSLFAAGLLSLLAAETHLIDLPIWPIFLGLCTYVALEFAVKHKRLFKAGIDDALLLLAAGLITGGFVWAVSNVHNADISICAFLLLLCLYLALRFSDTFMAIVSCLSFFGLVFFSWIKAGTIAKVTMPFVMMLFSYLLYYAAKTVEKRFINYTNCLIIVQVLSLLTLYVAGNYFVLQKLSNELHHLPQETNAPLPLGWFFWVWTMILPCIYLALGIRNKSILLLRTGLLLLIAAAFTLRIYYHLIPLEYAFMIAGTSLLLMALSLIKYLKTSKNTFTYAQRSRKFWADHIQLESLLVAGTVRTAAAPASNSDRFGGGSFGGAGSSSDF
jgi:uncharacterized membrane protein YgcG